MKLTPLEIRHKEFKRALRGYLDSEADEFLDEVTDQYERLCKDNIALSGRCAEFAASQAVPATADSDRAPQERRSTAGSARRRPATNLGMTKIENAVMDKLTMGDLLELRSLREQWEKLAVTRRHRGPQGFWLILETQPDCPRVGKLNADLGDVVAQLWTLRHPMSFELSIRDGFLDSFEGSTFAEPLPPDLEFFTVEYATHGERDWSYVRRVLAGHSTTWPQGLDLEC
jgi:DivIVA domain-containing protein